MSGGGAAEVPSINEALIATPTSSISTLGGPEEAARNSAPPEEVVMRASSSTKNHPHSQTAPVSAVHANTLRSTGSNPKVTLLPKAALNTAPAGADLEKKKNEIVTDMLRRLRPFVTPHGHLKIDADFEAYAALMAGETHFVQRTLLLTVLLGAGGENKLEILQAMSKCSKLLTILADWISECGKNADNPMMPKLLDLLLQIPLSVDQLVELRLGKIMKRLANTATAKPNLKQKAMEICETWTKLAKQEDLKRKHSLSDTDNQAVRDARSVRRSPSSSSGEAPPRDLKAAKVSEAAVVANLSLFQEKGMASTSSLPPPLPPLKTRAAQILERAAKGEAGSDRTALTPTSRPLSADDIHKAKKRQQYLANASQQQLSTGSLNNNLVSFNNHQDHHGADEHEHDQESHGLGGHGHDRAVDVPAQSSNDGRDADTEAFDDSASSRARVIEAEPKAKRVKKRVSFANEDELVKVHYFDPADEEYYHSERDRDHRKRPFTSHFGVKPGLDGEFHAMERNEASFAFKQAALIMEPECDWMLPKVLPKDLYIPRGQLSTEREVQDRRERVALSAVYFTENDVPPSPNENIVDSTPPDATPTRRIPLKDSEGRIVPLLRYVNQADAKSRSRDYPGKHDPHSTTSIPRPPAPPPALGNDLLSSILGNSNALQDLLKNVSSVTAADPPLNAVRPLSPPFAPPIPPAHMGGGSMTAFSPEMFHSSPPPPFPFPMVPPPMGLPPMVPPPMVMGMGFPFSRPPPLSRPGSNYAGPQAIPHSRPLSMPPPIPHPMAHPTSHQPSVKSHRRNSGNLCKYYRKGRPDSCRNGTACQFYHADY